MERAAASSPDRLTPPIALTIAGSDSGGGAGIQADLKTFQAFGVFGTSAITAITAQNTLEVSAVHEVPREIVVAQIAAVATDLAPRAFKTGMLATTDLVEAVAAAITDYRLPNYVLDPVMVASSGARLLAAEAEISVAERLVPLATVVTPNLDEVSLLVGEEVRDVEGMRRAARTLVAMGARAGLVKGGHLDGPEVVDVLFDGDEIREWRRPKLVTSSTHGTGCTLSAAIAANLALGLPLLGAVERSLEYLHQAIRSAPALGAGHGPLNHWAPTG